MSAADEPGRRIRVPVVDDVRQKWRIEPNRGAGMCFFLVVCQWLGPEDHPGANSVFVVINLLLRSLLSGNLARNHPCPRERIAAWQAVHRAWRLAICEEPSSSKELWIDDTDWADIACLLDATVCMFYEEEWHITSGNVLDTELLWRTRGSTTIWTNVGRSFPLLTSTAPRCIFFRLRDGHYELLRPRFPVPPGCQWGAAGQVVSVAPLWWAGWRIVDRDHLGPPSVFPVSH